MPTSPPRYGVLVPVKPPAVAKSRLGGLGDVARAGLATAFAVDTVSAALACPTVGCVLAVTDDHHLAAALAAAGAQVVPDGVAEDLNGSLEQAAAELHRRRPDLAVAALCADLPALRTDQLTRVLAAADPRTMSFLADTEGRGTTVLTAPDPDGFRPRFGPGSRRAHLAAGAYEIQLSDVATVRRDVDTPDDLAAALALGVGPRTALASTAVAAGHHRDVTGGGAGPW